VGMSASTLRYQPRDDGNGRLRERLTELAGQHRRHGYRMLHSRLRIDGWAINVKRTYRVYREEGLMVRKRRRKKLPEGWPRFRKFPPKSDLRRCRTRTFWRQKSCQYRRHHLWLHGATVVTAPAHAAAFFLVPLGWGAVAARRSTNPCTVWASMR